MKTELENIEKMSPVKLFKPKAIGILLKAIEVEVNAFVPDVETPDGRKQITSLAYKVARSKTAIDNLGKDFVAAKKAETAEIDAVRKTSREFLDDLKATVRQPLTDWEAAEEARVAKIQARIDVIRDLGDLAGGLDVLLTSGQLTANLETLRDMKITKIYGEWQDEALNEKNAAIVALTEEIPKAKDREFEAAENDRRRQEEEDSQRVENEQRIAREAVEAAEIEAKQELQDKLDEEQRLKDEQEARERNTQHKGKVHREIAADITTMLVPYAANADLDELSKKLVKAMVKGQIRHTTINY